VKSEKETEFKRNIHKLQGMPSRKSTCNTYNYK